MRTIATMAANTIMADTPRALPGFDESNVMGGRIPEPHKV